MTPEDLSKIDQNTATAADILIPYLKRMYDNCLNEGFTDEQAMRIVIQLVANMRST